MSAKAKHIPDSAADAWKAIKRYIARHRRPLNVKAKKRRWTRDSLHDR